MTKTIMTSVDRALSLLRHFTARQGELGLSELARLSGFDKTTTLRCLTALERNRFVEQDQVTRRYRLGLAPVLLAQIREDSFPLQGLLKRELDRLAAELGETAHATLLQGNRLATALIREPDRPTRVSLLMTEELPIHATASGASIAAFLPAPAQDALLDSLSFERFGDTTPGDRTTFAAILRQVRETGLARSDQWLERDVIGTAAPFFGPDGLPIGAVAIAAVASRFDADLAQRIDAALRRSAATLSAALGGGAPMPAAPARCPTDPA